MGCRCPWVSILLVFHSKVHQLTHVLSCSDGTIVSGDSLGTVKFWDSRTCTQLQSFQAHGADVLCLTVSPVSQHNCSCHYPLPMNYFLLGWKCSLYLWCRPKSRSIHIRQNLSIRRSSIFPPSPLPKPMGPNYLTPTTFT